MTDVTTTGFLLAGFAWVLWWNLDWRRYIKAYGISNPSDHPWIAKGLRVFFAICLLGGTYEVGHLLFQKTRPVQFYWHSFLVAAAWFVVIVVMVKIVEWTTGV
jgi:hypothetical protein